MKFVESKASSISENNPYKQVERIGRICYKSEDKITNTSYIKFYEMLKNNEHFAMLEHGWITYRIDSRDVMSSIGSFRVITTPWVKYGYYKDILYVSVSLSHLYNPIYSNVEFFSIFRQIAENTYLNAQHRLDNPFSISIAEPPEILKDRLTFKSIHFICDRGVSHELVRHRCAVAQESTRYCNYTKDKFGNEIAYVYPSKFNEWSDDIREKFLRDLQLQEMLYMDLISNKIPPEQARACLPTCLKTEVVLTMNIEQWQHFIDVRYKGTTGKPHPDMVQVTKFIPNILCI